MRLSKQNPPKERKRPELQRSIGPVQLALYGLGSMLGAGIYGLIGKATGLVGNAVWLAFVVALIAALLTALSYASLGSRYPRAAGAAYVTERAFGLPLLSFVVGLALVCSGLTSVPPSRACSPPTRGALHLKASRYVGCARLLLVLAGSCSRHSRIHVGERARPLGEGLGYFRLAAGVPIGNANIWNPPHPQKGKA